MPAAYSYVRFSTKGKQEEGDSYRRQIDNSRKWIKSQKDVWEATNYPTIEDLGVSAFKGKNLDRKQGGLGKFIEFCETGEIPRGSYLILESLDRFSRADPLHAAQELRDLIENYGLRLVTLVPIAKVITAESFGNTFSLLQIVMELCAANSYSVLLSNRLKQSWQDRREEIREGGTLGTKNIPSWIDLEIAGTKKNKEYILTLNKEKAELIRYVFKRIIDGVTQRQLVLELNSKFPPVARYIKGKRRSSGHSWSHSYVSKLLNDRRLLGEMQLFKKNDAGRLVPDGEPVADYYPRVLSDDTFYSAQAQKNKHKKLNSLKKNDTRPNILKGLIVCAADGHNMYLINGYKKRKDGSKYKYSRLQSYGYRIGKSKFSLTVDYSRVEGLILDSLSELRKADIQTLKPNSKKIKDCNTVITGIKVRLEEIERRLVDDRYIDEFSNNLDMKHMLKKKLKKKMDELNELLAVVPRNKKDILKDLHVFRPSGLTKEEKDKLYSKYAQIIPDIIEKIVLLPYQIGTKRNAAIGWILLKSKKKRMFIIDADDSVRDTIYTDKEGNPIWLYTKDGHVFWEVQTNDDKPVEIYASFKNGNKSQEHLTPNPFAVLKRLQSKNQQFAKSAKEDGKKTATYSFEVSDFAINKLENTGTEENPTEYLDKQPMICKDGRQRWS